ncbi:MAG TPA: glutamyl-tRNA reductase [Candidatus Methylacidiphilales bacterium]|nr:glutamyl-tRNA reductase [Candidatus Methylacidiphilales bacterium]
MSAQVICGGLTFEKTPVELREKVAFRDSQLPEALLRMRELLGLREAVLISTCNRVEYFGATSRPEVAAAAWPDFLRRFHTITDDFSPLSFQMGGMPCVEHLFSVAAGLKSMVVGETEILGQLKDAYDVARANGQTGKWLNRLFQSSFAAAKSVRSHTAITRGSVSVGSVAVELAEKIFGDLCHCRVMVIGAGETSARTARSLLSRGVPSIFVANRTFDRAHALAAELGGEAVRWDEWEDHAVGTDIIISSTSAPHYVLTSEKLEGLLKWRGQRPLFLIDLAVPRDFEPSINLLDDVYLYDIDDLQSIAQAHLRERQTEIVRSVEILKPHVARYMAWVERQVKVPDIKDAATGLTTV